MRPFQRGPVLGLVDAAGSAAAAIPRSFARSAGRRCKYGRSRSRAWPCADAPALRAAAAAVCGRRRSARLARRGITAGADRTGPRRRREARARARSTRGHAGDGGRAQRRRRPRGRAGGALHVLAPAAVGARPGARRIVRRARRRARGLQHARGGVGRGARRRARRVGRAAGGWRERRRTARRARPGRAARARRGGGRRRRRARRAGLDGAPAATLKLADGAARVAPACAPPAHPPDRPRHPGRAAWGARQRQPGGCLCGGHRRGDQMLPAVVVFVIGAVWPGGGSRRTGGGSRRTSVPRQGHAGTECQSACRQAWRVTAAGEAAPVPRHVAPGTSKRAGRFCARALPVLLASRSSDLRMFGRDAISTAVQHASTCATRRRSSDGLCLLKQCRVSRHLGRTAMRKCRWTARSLASPPACRKRAQVSPEEAGNRQEATPLKREVAPSI